MPKISAKEIAEGLRGRRSPAGVEITTESDGTRSIRIDAAAANQLLGVGTSGPGPDQSRVRRFRPRVSGLELLRFNRLTAERERRGLSVAELAQSSGLPAALVERMEAAADVPEGLREQLAAGLGADVDAVFPFTASAGATGPDSSPATFRPLPKPSRGEIAEANERATEKAIADFQAAQSAKQATEARRQLNDLRRDLEINGLRAQALTLQERIEAL
jgi:transcriptional regulator with XRE-family HTH domain